MDIANNYLGVGTPGNRGVHALCFDGALRGPEFMRKKDAWR
jgi:hypothetical protein